MRGAERRFKEAARSFLDVESYKEALLTFLSLFEAYFNREDYGKAVSLCREVLGIAEMLVDRPAIQRAWEELLVLAQSRTLVEGQLQALRQYCTRYWSAAAPQLSLTAIEAPVQSAGVSPEIQVAAHAAAPVEPARDALLGDAYHDALEARERELFQAAFEECHRSIRGTARALGMSRNTVRQKAERYNLKPTD